MRTQEKSPSRRTEWKKGGEEEEGGGAWGSCGGKVDTTAVLWSELWTRVVFCPRARALHREGFEGLTTVNGRRFEHDTSTWVTCIYTWYSYGPSIIVPV